MSYFVLCTKSAVILDTGIHGILEEFFTSKLFFLKKKKKKKKEKKKTTKLFRHFLAWTNSFSVLKDVFPSFTLE